MHNVLLMTTLMTLASNGRQNNFNSQMHINHLLCVLSENSSQNGEKAEASHCDKEEAIDDGESIRRDRSNLLTAKCCCVFDIFRLETA